MKRERKISCFLLPFFVAVLFLFPIAAYGERTTPFSGNPQKGEAIYKERFCQVCHSINGKGGKVGPDLTQVTVRRSEEWLSKWLKDPKALVPDTPMPTIDWASKEEVRDLIAYFKTLRKDIDRNVTKTMEPVYAGKKLVEGYDCKACHRIKGEGGRERYPDLTNVSSRRSAEWMRNWLKDPQTIKPGTFMPTFSFSAEEIKAIVAYLETLQ